MLQMRLIVLASTFSRNRLISNLFGDLGRVGVDSLNPGVHLPPKQPTAPVLTGDIDFDLARYPAILDIARQPRDGYEAASPRVRVL